ncbi:redoxin domain-containing protein [Flavihumibacter solisilvae]|jgi:thiol-disulfide isomerase/thioredoxin|uniref:Thioredoxin domain-containing protein n=1 Tax=Flavihumibacter solisilvae TaxID=1349421 RepID=A0A0C1IYV3_9BACT|nr:redoxin domain-containing protein [Flavihumibacter solisilvae]KIC95654.1 hypothetical protein OI18_05245 [Flavihumibacter solisilvae]
MRLLLFILLLFPCTVALSQQAATHFSPRQIKSISLTTPGDQPASLTLQKQLTVIVFLSPDCPLCKNYAPVLNKLKEDFDQQVNFIGIIPGAAYTQNEITAYSDRYKLLFDLVVDKQKKLSKFLEASVTPEVLVIEQNGNLVYRGAIDDWVVNLGKKKLKAEHEYLRTAIQQFLYHQPVMVQRTTPKGCYINDY